MKRPTRRSRATGSITSSLKSSIIAAAVALALKYFDSGEAVMTRERLYLFDTTLRDGAQTNGVDFTLADKLAIAGMLDELGIDYVEGGYPGANPTDTRTVLRGPRARTRPSPPSA